MVMVPILVVLINGNFIFGKIPPSAREVRDLDLLRKQLSNLEEDIIAEM